MTGITQYIEMIDRMQKTDTANIITITQTQLEQCIREYSFAGLQNIRFGQHFCNYFDINDYILFFSKDYVAALHYIQSTYLENCG